MVANRFFTYNLAYYTKNSKSLINTFLTSVRPLTVADAMSFVDSGCELAFFKDVF